jgi:MFS family permease
MQTTAQQWLVYRLTGSVAMLGIFGFANQVPMLFLAWMGGYVGDRYNRHRGVIVTQTCSMILAFLLAALTLTHFIQEWHLIVIAFLVGIVNAFDVPIRQAFFVQMVLPSCGLVKVGAFS